MNKLVLAFFLAVVSLNLSATPLYYTFEGIISMHSTDGLVESGYSIGDKTNYTIMIDTDKKGELTHAGITTSYDDTSDYDYFYTDFISGDTILETTYYDIDESNLGYDRVLGGGIQDRLYIASDKRLYFWFDYETLTTLEINDYGIFENYWTNDSNELNHIRGNVFLKSISNTDPTNDVTSPSTMLLLFLGLMLLTIKIKFHIPTSLINSVKNTNYNYTIMYKIYKFA